MGLQTPMYISCSSRPHLGFQQCHLALGPSVLLLIRPCKQMIQLGAEVKDSSESEKLLLKACVPAPWTRLHLVVSGGAPQPVDGRLRLGFTRPKQRAKASSTGD